MQYRLWKLVAALLRAVPLRLAYAAADAVGLVTYAFWGEARRNMDRNYRRVLPHARRSVRREVARRSLQNYCRYLVDFARLEKMAPQDVSGYALGDEALAGLARVLEDGRGAVVVCMHFGNWDLGAAATAAHGVPVAAVAERFGDRRLDDDVFGVREGLGMRVFPMDGPLVAAVRHLRAGGALALLVDRPVDENGVEVEFFGVTTHVPAGPAHLALRTGSALIAAAMPRRERSRPDVTIEATFGLERERDSCDAVGALTTAVVRAHERYIRRWPDQWYMFRDMWPAQDEGNGR